jgi:hypothetical protein
MQPVQQFIARVQSIHLPMWLRILPLILMIPGLACTLPAIPPDPSVAPAQATQVAVDWAALQAAVDALWPTILKWLDFFDPVPEGAKESCDYMRIDYFEGIANGPVTVYWAGGAGWNNYTVDFYGGYDGIAETRLGGTSGSPGGAGSGLFGSPRASATFPIDSTVAHAIVDNNGYFKAVLSVSGVTGRYAARCSNKPELRVNVSGLQSTNPTAVPPTAVPPTAVPPSNSGQRSVEPTAIPPTARPTREPRPTPTEDPNATPQVTG